MGNDVNIDVKVNQADEAKRKLDQNAQAAKNVGDKTEEAGKRGAKGTKKSTEQLTGMGRVLDGLKTQVMSFVGAWLGLEGVKKLVTWLISKLVRAYRNT